MSSKVLKKVIRLDGVPVDSTFFTEEGYLIDNPIVTTTGIFEYHTADGTVRRELRIPEEVFHPDSLASFEGKPVVITHDAGTITKENVADQTIGTILSMGFQDEKDPTALRAKIVIHDTEAMKDCELKELSWGYNMDMEETSGTWEGESYDGIQTNIRINHLALVDKARAGETARLNVDGKESQPETPLKGETIMKSKKQVGKNPRKDGESQDNNLSDTLKEFEARREARMKAKGADQVGNSPVGDEDLVAPTAASDSTSEVKDRRDTRDDQGSPTTLDSALETIAQQDEDIDTLLGIIDVMTADSQNHDNEDSDKEDNDDEHEDNEDEHEDSDNEDENEDNQDSHTTDSNLNKDSKDSVDKMIRERLAIARIGDLLNMDGLEYLSPKDAKKKVIGKLKPSMRLDGKSAPYINGVFDSAVKELTHKNKSTNRQRGQMTRQDGYQGTSPEQREDSSSARQRMMDKQSKRKED